jgi:uncharacterized protein
MSPSQPVCLITGASAGIGAELARAFASHGHALVLVARREAQLAKIASAIAEDGHVKPQVIAANLQTPDGVEQLAQTLRTRGLEPAYVVNNAGFGLFGEAAALERERQLDMIDLNVRTLTDLSLRFIASVRHYRGGILNVASVAGFMPGPGMAVYHATKAYVVAFTEALHQELIADGVRVCALCPGPVMTKFLDSAGLPPDYFPAFLVRAASRVANEGYEGLMRGDCVVIPGKINRIVTLLPRLFPRSLVLKLMEERWRRSRPENPA